MVFYILKIKPSDNGRFKVDSFIYEKKVPVPETEKEAEELVLILCKGLFECDFEAFPEYV